MAQAGIIITQPGIDVKTAADYQMIFNSNWPSLQIAFEAIVDTSKKGFGVITTVNHNLGFVPFFQTWEVTGGINNGRVAYYVTSADKNNIYVNPTGLIYSIKCYNFDITQNKNYALPLSSTFKLPYDSSYGIKVVKKDKAITSNDLRDFILHSRAQSPAVLAVINQSTLLTTDTISYTNPAGYIPWAFAFFSSNSGNGSYAEIPPGQTLGLPTFLFSYPASLTGIQLKGKVVLTYSNGSGASGAIGYGSLVILRDPLVVSNKVNLRY